MSGSAIVDVHILTQPHERQDWLQYCLESLEREPVCVHQIQGVAGHIGLGRRIGLTHGTSEYAAYVDPDDLVCRGAFDGCLEALEANPQAAVAYTREAHISEGGCLLSEWDRKLYSPFFGTPDEAVRAHHLCVYRRSMLPNLEFLEEFPTLPEQALKRRIWDNNFVFVDRVGYQWRQHKASASRQRWDLSDEMQDILLQQRNLWRRVSWRRKSST